MMPKFIILLSCIVACFLSGISQATRAAQSSSVKVDTPAVTLGSAEQQAHPGPPYSCTLSLALIPTLSLHSVHPPPDTSASSHVPRASLASLASQPGATPPPNIRAPDAPPHHRLGALHPVPPCPPPNQHNTLLASPRLLPTLQLSRHHVLSTLHPCPLHTSITTLPPSFSSI